MEVLAGLQTAQEPNAIGAALKLALGFHNATLLGQGWQAPVGVLGDQKDCMVVCLTFPLLGIHSD
jgi:hypothetical protein